MKAICSYIKVPYLNQKTSVQYKSTLLLCDSYPYNENLYSLSCSPYLYNEGGLFHFRPFYTTLVRTM